MLHIQSSIDIETAPAAAFRLLVDAERKARLNPEIEVLNVAQVTDGPLGLGTRVFYSLQTAAGIGNFHCEVVAFEANRLIEWLSDTQPPFRVRQRLEPTATGCRLVHDEWLTVEVATAAPPRRGSLRELLRAFQQAAGIDAPMAAMAPDGSAELRDTLQRRLTLWLGNIKACLEATPAENRMDLDGASIVAF